MGFARIPGYSITRRIVRKGLIPGYKIGGTYYFVIAEVIRAINEYPEIAGYNWKSYEDNDHSQEEPIIHFRKYLYPDHILIKYHFRKETSYTFLPVELWRKDTRIGNAIIRLINKNLKAQSHERK